MAVRRGLRRLEKACYKAVVRGQETGEIKKSADALILSRYLTASLNGLQALCSPPIGNIHPCPCYLLFMEQATITIRPGSSDDAEGIAAVFLESAEYHAQLDPERYWVPPGETILGRYRHGRQHQTDEGQQGITLVSEVGGRIVGFIDARLERSPDSMHREMIYCQIVELAVSSSHQCQGIGGRLLRSAEEWGRQHDARFALLEYHAANARAGGFYQRRMGYGVAAITVIKPLAPEQLT